MCKESADAPHYLVKLQKEQAQYAMKMNVNDCAVDTLHGRALMPSRQRAKIAVPDKYGKKRFVVKLQSPLDIGPAASSAPIMLNDPTREMEGRECCLPMSGSKRKLTCFPADDAAPQRSTGKTARTTLRSSSSCGRRGGINSGSSCTRSA